MKRFVSAAAGGVNSGGRGIAGVAPVLHFPPTPKLPRDAQIEKNTKLALALIRRSRGAVPAPYVRRHNTTIEQIEEETERLLGGAQNLRKNVADDEPMDKMTLMERTLRHGIWAYKKDEGKHNFEAYRRWLVYTPTDEMRVNALRRQVDLEEKYEVLRAKRVSDGGPAVSMPKFDWAEEYKAAVDREVVAEKRVRYDLLALTTRERDTTQIQELLASYRRPRQLRRLDELTDLLERFKPVLAREAILQRLTIKHLEGQLGIWRYLDWCPEVRDRAELEVDNTALQWWSQWEEKRLSQIKLRSKNEVAGVMERAQALSEASQGPAVSGGSGGDAARDKLLKEVLALQARAQQRDDSSTQKAQE